jgi:translation initiation factor 5A
MSSEDDYQKQTNDAFTYPSQAGALKKGDIILIKDKPCKVLEISTSKTGKHGHAKANITALDIFDDKKAEDSVPTSHNVMCVVTTKTEYDLTNLTQDGGVTLMDANGEYREDLSVDTNSDIFKDIQGPFDKGLDVVVTVLSAMGREKIIAYRVDKKD